MMNKYLWAGLFVIVAVIGVYLGFRGYVNHKESFRTLDYSTRPGEITSVVVKGHEIVTTNSEGKQTITEIPRKSSIRIGVEESGDYTIDKASPLQMSWHLGLEYDSTSVQPQVGIQLLRWHKLGISGNLSPKGVSLSVERDLYDFYPAFQNTFIGLGYRSDQVLYLSVGVYL